MWIALYPSTVLFWSRETLVLKLHCSGLPHLYTQCPTLLPASTGQVTPSGGKKWPRLASPDPASLPSSSIGSSLWVPSFTAQWIYPVPNLPNRPSHLCIKTSHLFASKFLSVFCRPPSGQVLLWSWDDSLPTGLLQTLIVLCCLSFNSSPHAYKTFTLILMVPHASFICLHTFGYHLQTSNHQSCSPRPLPPLLPSEHTEQRLSLCLLQSLAPPASSLVRFPHSIPHSPQHSVTQVTREHKA